MKGLYENINHFLRETYDPDNKVRPWIRCDDGFCMSVQASQWHYCNPREDNMDIYESVEIGYPSLYEPLLDPYDGEHGTVFAFVPTSIVNDILEKHGGIAKIIPNTADILFGGNDGKIN